MSPTLNPSKLLSVLPLLATLPFISATPARRESGFIERESSSSSAPDFFAKRQAAGNVPIGGFETVGDSGISAQMMFLGTKQKVYILDKSENNPVTITGALGTHPAWAVEYDVNSNEYRTMDVLSNTFCAGGAVLGNGTWVIFGGNQPVTTGGVAVTNGGAYDNHDGGTAIRMITPCDDESCEYVQGTTSYATTGNTGGWLQMTGRRWYPMVEALQDGSLIIIGGDKNGGYVNTPQQDNPTYEFWPPRGDGAAINLQFLTDTLPVNLYALTWLMPSGKLFMQASRSTILYDVDTLETTNLPDMPHATRVYPASAATAMLPLTPDNNYTVSLVFCGGSNPPQWGDDGSPRYNVTAVPADNTCVRITPEAANPQYTDDDDMLEGRSMGQFVMLPDGTFWMGNGVAMGTAGYGDPGQYSIGQSFGQDPLYIPAIYNPAAPAGSRWNRTGLTASPHERMYHSTAVLLADGSIMVSGSNPNADFTQEQWGSKTSVERWYPSYYSATRPTYTGAPTTLSYGGQGFDIVIPGMTDETIVQSIKIRVIRGGFNTHAIGFGQRMLELRTTYSIDMNTGNTTMHVAQLPGTPGPTLFQPGPAMFFVVVNGVPAEGEMVMVGSGALGIQPTALDVALPESVVVAVVQSSSAASSTSTGSQPTSGSSNANVSGASLTRSLGLASLAAMAMGIAGSIFA